MDDNNGCYPVGAIPFADVQLECEIVYVDAEWLIELTSWEQDADPNDLPESCWGLLPTHARQLAAILTQAAEAAELFNE